MSRYREVEVEANVVPPGNQIQLPGTQHLARKLNFGSRELNVIPRKLKFSSQINVSLFFSSRDMQFSSREPQFSSRAKVTGRSLKVDPKLK